jgi:hypothetical protein
MSDDDMTRVVDNSKDIRERWEIAEPYWRAAESTEYGRSLSIAARELYVIDRIDVTTIEKLNRLFQEARIRGGHYDFVLKNKSGIPLSICDYLSFPHYDTDDLFAIAMRVTNFVCPTHYVDMRKKGMEVGIEVHTLADWMEVTRRHIEKYLNSPEAARHALVEWLDTVPANKISAFGGDYHFVDGVYGHQYLVRQNVTYALAQKVIDGSFSLARAKEIASWVFCENPKRLFGLDRLL